MVRYLNTVKRPARMSVISVNPSVRDKRFERVGTVPSWRRCIRSAALKRMAVGIAIAHDPLESCMSNKHAVVCFAAVLS